MSSVTPITEFDGLDSLQERSDFDQLSPAEQFDAIEDLGRQANAIINRKIAAKPNVDSMTYEFSLMDHLIDDHINGKPVLIINEIISNTPTVLWGTAAAFILWMSFLLLLVGIQIAYAYYVAVLARPHWEVWLMSQLHLPLFSLQLGANWHPEYIGIAAIGLLCSANLLNVGLAIRKHR